MSSSRRATRTVSSSKRATLTVQAHEAVEVAVLDDRFSIVAQGNGNVVAKLAPGIYEVQLSLGPTRERRLVKLEAGERHEERAALADPNLPSEPDAVRLAVPSAAPVQGTSTTREEHQQRAFEASAALAGTGARSGVVLMVRTPRGTRARFSRGLAARVSLVEADLAPVQIDWRVGRDWATAFAPLEPGGYAMRVDPSARSNAAATFQSLWAARGWQTLVFVANTDGGLAPERAALHMTRFRDPWQPRSEQRETDLAVEDARWSLRQRRPGISQQLLRLLLRSKFGNPMLGILGAHVLLLGAKPSRRQLDEVIRNLANLVPGHPDVRALEWLRDDARRKRRGDVGDGISWPPMLAASYDAAIRRDAYRPGAIVDGSPAELTAAQLVVTGIWTSWRQPTQERQPPGPREIRPHEPDPAQARVLDYVDALATRSDRPRHELLETLDEQQCALGAGLPTAVVRRVLGQLREGEL